ncbi:MAG: ethanolamine ammonia-lyase reactivating factor EutA, partial [Synergistaceae bacterium]
VAESVYEENSPKDCFAYNDIGILLGSAIRESMMFRTAEIVKPAETIRATVVGAGSHTVNVSGSTINYTKDIFPLKNIPVMKCFYTVKGSLAASIKDKIKLFMTSDGYQNAAVGLIGLKSPSFDELNELASEIKEGLSEPLKEWDRVIILLEEDMGKAMGIALGGNLPPGINIISLDNIHVEDGDYIDIGRPMGQGRVIPVVVKTLVFGA